jgi:5'-nucleotidase
VVVSGHTHRAYVCHADRAGGGDLLYSSAGSYGRYLTDIDLQLDVASGRLLSASAHNRIVVNDTATDPDPRDDPPLPAQPAVAAIVEHYDRRVAALKSRVLGRLEGAFTRTANAAGESALGDLVADAQLAATAAPEDGGADIAMTNPGGLRAGLSQPGGSVVSFGDVFTAQPFNNTLVTISLRGDALKALLEQQWRSATAPPRVLQVSQGFRYAWRAHAARGHHVDAASMRLHGAPIEPARVYKVTVNSFLAGGGDGFPVLRDAPARIESATLDADALARYIERHAPLAVPRADRILRQD